MEIFAHIGLVKSGRIVVIDLCIDVATKGPVQPHRDIIPKRTKSVIEYRIGFIKYLSLNSNTNPDKH